MNLNRIFPKQYSAAKFYMWENDILGFNQGWDFTPCSRGIEASGYKKENDYNAGQWDLIWVKKWGHGNGDGANGLEITSSLKDCLSGGTGGRMRDWNQDFRSDTVIGNVKLEYMHMGVSDLDEVEGEKTGWRNCEPGALDIPCMWLLTSLNIMTGIEMEMMPESHSQSL